MHSNMYIDALGVTIGQLISVDYNFHESIYCFFYFRSLNYQQLWRSIT